MNHFCLNPNEIFIKASMGKKYITTEYVNNSHVMSILLS